MLLPCLLICLSSPIIIPLVESYCNEGFMDEQLLHKKAAQISNSGDLSANTFAVVNSTRWLFPQLKFGCSNGVITEATVGIDIRGFDHSYPSIELWKKADDNPYQYSKVVCGYTIRLSSSNSTTDSVFTIKFPQPLVITDSHVLGIYQPRNADSTVRFFYENNATSTAYQIVNADDTEVHINSNTSVVPMPNVRLLVNVKTEPSSCPEGFIDLEELKNKSQAIANVVPIFSQHRVFPNISFTCEGYVTKWIIGGLNVTGDRYPRIRIAREDELSLREAVILNPFFAVNTALNVFEYHHNPALHVKHGDLLVMYHSGHSEVNKIVYYQEVSGPDNYRLTNEIEKIEENIYPLVSVVVEKSLIIVKTQTSELSSPAETNPAGSTITNALETQQTSTVEQYIIGVMGTLIGTLGLMLLIAVTLVIFLVLHIRRKRELIPTPSQRASLANSIVLIDFSANESTLSEPADNKRIKVLNGSFRGRKLIVRSAEDVIEKLHESSSKEIRIQAQISLTDGDIDSVDDISIEQGDLFITPSNNIDILWTQLSEEQKRIEKQEIRLVENMQHGCFGEMVEAVWKSSNGTSTVSVCRVQNDLSNDDELKLLQTATIVIQFQHQNIIKLHGIAVVNGKPSLLVFESCSSSLKHYLQQINQLDEKIEELFISFCCQIASGMDYLHTNGYIHGNLCLRNVQLTNNKNCKINGFFENGLENTSPVEVAKTEIRTKSNDILSYGVMMREIWKLEASQSHNDDSQQSMIPTCPTLIYELIQQCREVEADKRLDFASLKTNLMNAVL